MKEKKSRKKTERINHAVKENNLEKVKSLLSCTIHKSDFKFSFNNAAKFGYIDIFKLIVIKNKEINILEENIIKDAFWNAINKNKINIIEYFLKNKENLKINESYFSNQAFIQCCSQGNIDIIKIIEKNIKFKLSDDVIYNSFLKAARYGKYKTIKHLFENNKINKKTLEDGILQATINNKKNTVRYLLSVNEFNEPFLNCLFSISFNSNNILLIEMILRNKNCNPKEIDFYNSFPKNKLNWKFKEKIESFTNMYIIILKNRKISKIVNTEIIKDLFSDNQESFDKLNQKILSLKIEKF